MAVWFRIYRSVWFRRHRSNEMGRMVAGDWRSGADIRLLRQLGLLQRFSKQVGEGKLTCMAQDPQV